MSVEFLMGNEAIALGALHAGVNLVSGYPGTPSTEILETAAKRRKGSVYVEWSANEKAALEVAAGASYAGARTMVTMKQVGLNVAADPALSLAYVGVKGGLVIVSADDPGPISSQTEQDTRSFARFAKLPVFDPSSPEEAYQMIQDAFELSEKYSTPVILRPTTRVCHSCASVLVGGAETEHKPDGFIKDSQRWVVFPKTSYLNHIKIEKRYSVLSDEFSEYKFNRIEGDGETLIACGGVSYAYVQEALKIAGIKAKVLKISTPYPFPEKLAVEFMQGADEVLVVEELDPVIERELIYTAGKNGIKIKVRGKLTGDMPCAGENSVEIVKAALCKCSEKDADIEGIKKLPERPPVLCAGCPHRASFYAVKRAMKGKKAVFSGDIGCYTLGNAKPLDMVDTCLCMGAGITIAQGLHRIEPDAVNFAFVGDSTFFASGITGVVNAVYNNTDMVLIVLDNDTTAMTGKQPHPGTGVTMTGPAHERISIKKVLKALGLSYVKKANPLDLKEAVTAVKEAVEAGGVSAVIFESPCVAAAGAGKPYKINNNCVNCKKCIKELGCPAITITEKKVKIDDSLCSGCGLCVQICPKDAIKGGKDGK